MKEEYAGNELSIWKLMGKIIVRIRSLSWSDRLRIAYFCMAFMMLVVRVENHNFIFLVGLAINLLYAYERVRENSIIEKLFDNDNTKEDKEMSDQELLRGLFEGAVLHEPQIVIAQSGSKVTYKEVTSAKEEKPQVTDEQIASAIQNNQSMFWAQSAWAVFFCVCRDHLGMKHNMTEIEHYIKGLPFTQALAYECPEGTIQKALSNNAYMKLPIDKWKVNGGKERAILLAEKLIAELDPK